MSEIKSSTGVGRGEILFMRWETIDGNQNRPFVNLTECLFYLDDADPRRCLCYLLAIVEG